MIIGASLKRKEDPRLLTGRGAFVDDVHLPQMLHAVIVRSPHAHARIRSMDTRAVRAAPGVALVVTPDDLAGVGQIPTRLGPHPTIAPFLQYPLARGRVRYVGEPVAVVVAASRYAAEDAAEQLAVDYEPLPPVLDAEAAQRPDAPVLHEAAGTNVAARLSATVGDPAGTLAAAPVRLRRRLRVQRHTGVPLETRGLVAALDPATGRLTVWGPTKVPHFNRRVLAALLGWPVERIRFLEPDVGGGFGVRGEFYPEDFLVPWAAIRLVRPVKWIEDRREHLMATNHSREQVHDVEIGATREGRLLALVDRAAVDMGAFLRTHGVVVPELTQAMLPGPYRIPHYASEIACVVTNKTPTGTYRSPGRYEANFVRERMMDALAETLGLDPVEVRRRNVLRPDELPYDVGTATLGHRTVYDTGDYASTLRAAVEAIGGERLGERVRALRAAGRLVGMGIGCFVEKAGPGPWETARVEVHEGGRVVVFSGGASVGQGVETAFAQIAAEALGVRFEDVTVVHGDTDAIADGVGAWGSRLTVVGGSAVLVAAQEVRARVLERAAARLEADAADLVIEGGEVWVRGAPARRVRVAKLVGGAGDAASPRGAGMARDDAASPRGADQERAGAAGILSASHTYPAPEMTYPYGAHAVLVEVDPGTGQVTLLDYAVAYDVGRAVNPRLVEGQLLGGLAQGVGGALLERFAYDDAGQPLAVTFMDYLLPTAMEMPRRVQVTVLEEAPTPLNPLGVKGAGEGGVAAAGAAIANAVADALRPLGVEVAALPLDPDRILGMIAAAGTRGVADRSGRSSFQPR